MLVNAASALERDAWDDATRATWDMHIQTNLRAPLVLIQQFANALPPTREGVVINLLDQRVCPQLVSYTLIEGGALDVDSDDGACSRAAHSGQRDQRRGPIHDPGAEIGQAALAILAFASMTGQMIVPDGAPPPA